MAKANGSVTLRTSFPAGAKVALHRRVGESYGQEVVATATVSKRSEARFTDLDPFAQFFAVAKVDGETRAVAVTAKPSGGLGDPGLATSRAATAEQLRRQAEAQSAQTAAAVEKDPLAGSPALDGPDPTRQIVHGARSTTNSQRVTLAGTPGSDGSTFALEQTGKPLEGDVPHEPQPAPRQEDAGNVAQRSATLTGEATPVEKGELQPEVPQSEVPDKTPQRSDTALGSAAIVEKGEVQPSLRQEDVPKGTQQRSDTETGEAEPIPGAPPIKAARERRASSSKAKGRTPAKPRAKTTKGAKGAAKKSSGSAGRSKAARSRAAKKAAATRKRNARKSS